MKLALYQSPPTNGDEDAAFARISGALSAAAAAGAEMAVLPELMLPGYNQPKLQTLRAQALGGPWEDRLSDLCRSTGCGVAIGWAERQGDQIYNAASVFDTTGAKLAHYRKRQLYGPVERSVFTPGDDIAVFDLGGRRTALLICYDVEFADLVRHVAEHDTEVLLVPTANPEGFEIVQDLLVPARAYETRMTIAYANYCGTEDGLAYGGKSLVAGPDGKVLASAGVSETLLVVDLPTIEALDPERLSTQHIDRRPLPHKPDC